LPDPTYAARLDPATTAKTESAMVKKVMKMTLKLKRKARLAITKKPAKKCKKEEDEGESTDGAGDVDDDYRGPEIEETTEEWEKERAAILKKIKHKTLDQKVELFRQYFDDKKNVQNRSKYLKLFFKKDEMSKLWGKLQTAMKKCSAETQKEWDRIKELPAREGKTAAKQHVLALKLCCPEDWEHRLASSSTVAGKRTSHKKTKEKFYRGELDVKHGKDEAEWMIKKGKYKEEEDSDGDTVYVRTNKTEVEESYKEEKTESHKSAKMNAEESKALEASIDNWMKQQGGSLMSLEDMTEPRGTKTKKAMKAAAVKDDDEDEEKKSKNTKDLAKSKGYAMVRLLDSTSTKLLKFHTNMKLTRLNSATKHALKDYHSKIETARKELQGISVSAKVSEKDLKKKITSAAILIKDC